ncbi:MAG: hypothetical protein AB7P03_21435 [Kofleriaceae bacterium]
MIREDYIMRLIRQFAEALKRIVAANRAQDYAAAIDETGRAWETVLGHPRQLVEVLDGPTLASMLREPEKIRVGAELLVEEGRAHAGRGNPVHAAVCYRRALELYLEARAIRPIEQDDEAILELSREVPASQLDPRYRS